MTILYGDRFRVGDQQPRAGGFSDVFKAYDLEADPPTAIAIKILRYGQLGDALSNAVVAREFEALERLHHPNIVQLIDAGVHPDSGKRYLALEWVESNLDSFLGSEPPGPDDFLRVVGLPIAAALAYAHSQNVAHRDVKPANVLMTGNDQVKLADFGIAKILDVLTDSPHTMALYGTPPFSPPESDSSPLSRDVWGFGMTLLAGLTRAELPDFESVDSALAKLDVPPAVEELIRHCLVRNPTDRPRDCRVVHARLESIWRDRSKKWTNKATIHVVSTRTVADAMGINSQTPMAEIGQIVADLCDAPAICGAPNEKGADRHFKLYGNEWIYRVASELSANGVPRLKAIAAYPPSGGELERAREQMLVLEDVEFKAGLPVDRERARKTLSDLVDRVDLFELETRGAGRLTEAERVLDQWRKQMDARTHLEKQREHPVHYNRFNREGRRAVFRLREQGDQVAIGEIRRLFVQSGTAPVFVRGEVESIDGGDLTLYLDEKVDGIPAKGTLVVDTNPSRIKIQRERSAVDLLALNPDKAARADLGTILFDPSTCAAPSLVEVAEWRVAGLDDSKKSAVRSALGSSDLFLVQGPPGTGKTTFIAELVAQELLRNSNAKILITSQTNVALDHALDRIDRIGVQGRIIRLADVKYGRVSPEAEKFRVDKQLSQWKRLASGRSQAWLEAWVEIKGVSFDLVTKSLLLHEWAELVEREQIAQESLQRHQKELERVGADTARDVTDELKELIQDLLERKAEDELFRRRFEKENPKLVEGRDLQSVSAASLRVEADGCLGGMTSAQELRALISLQGEWLQRLGRGDGFIAALAQDSSIIGATCVGLAAVRELAEIGFDLCIIDECSKATATETLVPMVRARRWVLVGDQRQLPPMVDDALKDRSILDRFEVDETELHNTLFDRLVEGLPQPSKAILVEQHRMVPAIGDLISSCFYEGQLISRGPLNSAAIAGVLPKPVTWHDTGGLPDHHEQRPAANSFSFVNAAEARTVTNLLKQLDATQASGASRSTVLVIAPYAAQVAHLKRRVDQLGELVRLAVEVTTVDAVQGREADFVIFSVTRSNAQRDPGFLRLDARANVALSRARFGLAIVGDIAFCRSTETPFRDVVNYISTHKDSCAIEEAS